MQRRAAAAYFVFFLVLSVAAYAYIGIAESQRPEPQLDGPTLTNDSTFTADGTTYTVSNVHVSSGGGHGGGGSMVADLTWTNGSSEETVELSEGGNITLANGQQYFAHFPNESAVQIASSDQYASYTATLADQDYFKERTNGFWGISILSGIAAALMLGMAYMPVRG